MSAAASPRSSGLTDMTAVTSSPQPTAAASSGPADASDAQAGRSATIGVCGTVVCGTPGAHPCRPRGRALAAHPPRRSRSMRPVPARLPAARGTARLLLRARESRRSHRARYVRPQLRLRHRPGREETAQPFPARLARTELRHGRLQLGLPVLPELGYLARPRLGSGRRPGSARTDCAGWRPIMAWNRWRSRTTTRLCSPSTRSTRPRPAGSWASIRSRVTAGYMSAAARPDFYGAMDAANIDLKGFTESFYWSVTGTHLRDVLDTIEYAGDRDDGVGGADDAADSRPQRRRCAVACRVCVDPRPLRCGRAAALLRIPSGVSDDGRAGDAVGHAGPGAADRDGGRVAVRVHRQCAPS